MFFKAYGMWALLKNNESICKREDYGKKNFTIISLESLSLAKEIMNINHYYTHRKIDSDYYDYGLEFFQYLFVPFADRNIKLYDGIHHNKP